MNRLPTKPDTPLKCGRCLRRVHPSVARTQACLFCDFVACRCTECNGDGALDKALARHRAKYHRAPGAKKL